MKEYHEIKLLKLLKLHFIVNYKETFEFYLRYSVKNISKDLLPYDLFHSQSFKCLILLLQPTTMY